MGAIASQITSLTIVYSTVYSDADQRKQQSSASLAFVRGIHRGTVNSPHKWPVTRKMFPFDEVIMDFAHIFHGYTITPVPMKQPWMICILLCCARTSMRPLWAGKWPPKFIDRREVGARSGSLIFVNMRLQILVPISCRWICKYDRQTYVIQNSHFFVVAVNCCTVSRCNPLIPICDIYTWNESSWHKILLNFIFPRIIYNNNHWHYDIGIRQGGHTYGISIYPYR